MAREVSGNLTPIAGTKLPYTPKIPSPSDEPGNRTAQVTDAFVNCASLNNLTGVRERRSQGNPVLTRK